MSYESPDYQTDYNLGEYQEDYFDEDDFNNQLEDAFGQDDVYDKDEDYVPPEDMPRNKQKDEEHDNILKRLKERLRRQNEMEQEMRRKNPDGKIQYINDEEFKEKMANIPRTKVTTTKYDAIQKMLKEKKKKLAIEKAHGEKAPEVDAVFNDKARRIMTSLLENALQTTVGDSASLAQEVEEIVYKENEGDFDNYLFNILKLRMFGDDANRIGKHALFFQARLKAGIYPPSELASIDFLDLFPEIFLNQNLTLKERGQIFVNLVTLLKEEIAEARRISKSYRTPLYVLLEEETSLIYKLLLTKQMSSP